MKKTIALILLLMLAIAPVIGHAATIQFTFTSAYPGWFMNHTIEMDDELTVGDLRQYVRELSGGADWKGPGESKDKLKEHYSGSVTISVPMPPNYVIRPNYVGPTYVGNEPPAATKAPSKSKAGTESNRSTYKNITGSTEYLYQVYANGKTFDFRLFDGDKKVAFLEKFSSASDGKTRLTLTMWQAYDDLKPVYTEDALKALENLDIAEVAINTKGDSKVYTLAELRAMLP